MECRETQTLLTAFHDGELPAAERARVEEHLRGCRECAARLADLGRIDRAAGVPDPGPAYWDRFNARVMERVEREADGPKTAVLRPKHGWMRQQLRYLLPAAAAAALVVVIVRLGGMDPGGPAPIVPPSVSGPAASALPAKKADNREVAPSVPPPVLTREESTAITRKERDRPAGGSPPARVEEPSRDRAAAPSAMVVPSQQPLMKYRQAPVEAPPSPAVEGMPSGMRAERKRMSEEAALMADRQGAGNAKSAQRRPASPCELARTLADRERFHEAEAAQRACLVEDLPAPHREKNLVFLAELLDRQGNVSEADAVIEEIRRQFPESLQLDLYLRRRPIVQERQK